MKKLPMLLAWLATAAAVLGTTPSLAQTDSRAADQTFPWKIIQMIVPSPAGSPPDVRARELAEKVSLLLGQPIVVVNKPGAGGAIGLQALTASAPDGHTIALCTDAPLTINPSVYERLPYDPQKDLVPVTLLFRMQLLLVAHPDVRASSVADLVRLAKSRPGKLFYGSAGNGTPPHILADLFKFTVGIDTEHVPYKGGPAATAALLAGDVAYTFDAPSQVLSYVKAGKLKALAVTGDRRLVPLPDVPTFTESGVPGMSAGWVGIVAPAGTPRGTVMRLNSAFAAVLAGADVRAYYDDLGYSILTGPPEEMARRIVDETPKWREIVKRAGITPG